jgi:hypothetical protein
MLDDMTIPDFASGPSTPDPDMMVWYGSNFCWGGGLQGTLWWLSEFGGQAGETWMLTDLPWGFDYVDTSGFYAGVVGVYLGGYFGTDPIPDITPAQFGPNANPLAAVNIIDAGGGNYPVYTGNSLPFNLIGPYEVVVESDEWAYYCTGARCNTDNVQRLTKYKVINSDGSPAANIPLGEIPDIGGWNCSAHVPVPGANSCTVATGTTVLGIKSLGMSATDANGQYTDIWTMGGHTYTPAGCGFTTFSDQWQLCGLAVVVNPTAETFSYLYYGLTFAGLQGEVLGNEVDMTINGNGTSYNIGPGNCAPLAEYPLCPYAIPKNTIITPNNLPSRGTKTRQEVSKRSQEEQ